MSKNTKQLITFAEVTTGNGYANDLAATTNDRLERTVEALVILNECLEKEGKETRYSINKLQKTTKDLGETFTEQSEEITQSVKSLESTITRLDEKNGKLQWALFFLTIVTVITALVEVWSILNV